MRSIGVGYDLLNEGKVLLHLNKVIGAEDVAIARAEHPSAYPSRSRFMACHAGVPHIRRECSFTRLPRSSTPEQFVLLELSKKRRTRRICRSRSKTGSKRT